MMRHAPRRHADSSPQRAGAALAIVLVLIGLFAALCQALTLLVAIQYRQAFHHADQAQVRRLAEAGILRGLAALKRDADWKGENWKPMLPGAEAVAVQLSMARSEDGQLIYAQASLTTPAGRVHKSNQTLDVTPASDSERSKADSQ